MITHQFEHKIGFTDIRRLLKERCLSNLGMEVADGLVFMTELKDVRNALMQVTEFKRLKAEEDSFGLDYMFDIR